MKLGVITDCFKKNFYDSVALAGELGFDGVQVYATTGEFSPTALSELDVAALREHLKKNGLVISALCGDMGGHGFEIEADNPDRIEKTKRIIDLAVSFDTKVVTTHIGVIPADAQSEKYRVMLSALRACGEYAAERGVRTVTENHGYFSQDANRVEKLINTVNHENFGALVDVGNFMCADEDPWKSVSVMAPYAYHVHVKDFHKKSGMEPNPGKGWFRTRGGDYLRGAIIGHGEAHVAQSLYVLKKSGYDGYLTVEFEGMEDKLVGIELGLVNLKKFWEMA